LDEIFVVCTKIQLTGGGKKEALPKAGNRLKFYWGTTSLNCFPPVSIIMARKKRDKSYAGDDGQQRVIDLGRPECYPPFADNSIKTSRFTLLSFFPLVRRCVGVMMFIFIAGIYV
jgi:hypothetical protein